MAQRVVPRAGNLRMNHAGAGDEDVDEAGYDEDAEVAEMKGPVEGEEQENLEEEVNEAGEDFTPFNLANERSDGYFDVNGNFVWKEEEAETDAWVANLSDTAMESAVGEASRRKKRQREGAAEEKSPAPADADDCIARIRRQLEEEETVKGAMRRLGKRPAGGKPLDATQKRKLDELMECCDALLGHGFLDVYDADGATCAAWLEKREAAEEDQRQQKRQATGVVIPRASSGASSGGTGSKAGAVAAPKPDTVFFEYKGPDGAVHGPFGASQILGWQAQGYFVGEGEVEMRRIPAKPDEEDAADELLGDLEDDDDDEAPGQGNEWKTSGSIDFRALV